MTRILERVIWGSVVLAALAAWTGRAGFAAPPPRIVVEEDEDWTAPDEITQRNRVRRGKVGGVKTRRRYLAEGNACAPGDVSVVENGAVFSILLDRFQLSLDEGAAGLTRGVFCRIRLDLTPPPGMRLKSFRQVLYGSVFKSRDARVVLDVNYQIGQRSEHPPAFIWRRGQVLTPDDPDASFAVTVKNKMRTKCKPSLPYMIRMDLTGVRDSLRKDFVLAGIDTVDGAFTVDLEPEFVPCG